MTSDLIPAQPNRARPPSRLRDLRKARGWSQAHLIHALEVEGRRLNTTVATRESLAVTVSRWENGKQEPEAFYRRLLCLALGVEESALGFRPLDPDTTPMPAAAGAEESVLDVAARMQRWGRVNVDPAAVNALFAAVQSVVDRYEHTGPQGLMPEVARLRRGIDVFLDGRQHPKQLLRTYKAAAKASGLLGYMAVNLSRPDLAVVYCDEAFQLARHADDRDLQAWVRGTQSFAAYYRGDYTQARDLARDGLRYANTSGQAIRLLINGEARALSRLGDAAGVDEAVDRAHALLDDVQAPAGMTSCISFDPYGHARVAANAATAYLSLGNTPRVLQYARPLDQAVEEADSDWSRSLVRLDVATALVRQRSPEVEEAARIGLKALGASATKPIASIHKRAAELRTTLDPWSTTRAVRAFDQALDTWRQPEIASPGRQR